MSNSDRVSNLIKKYTDEKNYTFILPKKIEKYMGCCLKTSIGEGYIRKYEIKLEVKKNMLLIHSHDFAATTKQRRHIIEYYTIKEDI